MTKFQVVAVALALFSVAYAERSQLDIGGIAGRDDWFREKQTYTDLPRIFNSTAACPAERFYLDCNLCHCAKEGSNQASCTAKGCPEIPQIVNWNHGSNGVVCPAGKPFYWKCNDCHCTKDGKGAMCTKKACPNLDE